MYILKIVNKNDPSDIALEREYESLDEAMKYYNLVVSMAVATPNSIYREANEEKGYCELKYNDILITIEDAEGKEIARFMIG